MKIIRTAQNKQYLEKLNIDPQISEVIAEHIQQQASNWYQLFKIANDINVVKKQKQFDDTIIDTTKYESPQGKIEIFENSPWSSGRDSITETVVNEEYRRKGEGTKLLQKALENRDKVSAQTSSKGSTIFFYNNGFRPVDNPVASLEETIEMFNKYQSLAMEWNRL